MSCDDMEPLLLRVVEALERLAPAKKMGLGPENNRDGCIDGFVWNADDGNLQPIATLARVDIDLLKGIDQQRETLLTNTLRFAKGLPANNALLWGARGMGKSSLVKAVHGAVNDKLNRKQQNSRLGLVEIHREDIAALPKLLRMLELKSGVIWFSVMIFLLMVRMPRLNP